MLFRDAAHERRSCSARRALAIARGLGRPRETPDARGYSDTEL